MHCKCSHLGTKIAVEKVTYSFILPLNFINDLLFNYLLVTVLKQASLGGWCIRSIKELWLPRFNYFSPTCYTNLKVTNKGIITGKNSIDTVIEILYNLCILTFLFTLLAVDCWMK